MLGELPPAKKRSEEKKITNGRVFRTGWGSATRGVAKDYELVEEAGERNRAMNFTAGTARVSRRSRSEDKSGN